MKRRKEDAACCVALMDDHGRLPIGYCGPDCERRSWAVCSLCNGTTWKLVDHGTIACPACMGTGR